MQNFAPDDPALLTRKPAEIDGVSMLVRERDCTPASAPIRLFADSSKEFAMETFHIEGTQIQTLPDLDAGQQIRIQATPWGTRLVRAVRRSRNTGRG